MLANHVFWRLMLFYTHLLLLLQPSVLWLSIVTFNNNAKPQPKWILREFDVLRTPPWNVYMAKFDPSWEGYPVWQTGLPALAGHPIYHVNVIKLKWELIWTGGFPSPRPHLHVNRPLDAGFRKIVTSFMLSDLRLGSFVSRTKYWNASYVFLSSRNAQRAVK